MLMGFFGEWHVPFPLYFHTIFYHRDNHRLTACFKFIKQLNPLLVLVPLNLIHSVILFLQHRIDMRVQTEPKIIIVAATRRSPQHS